MRNAIRESPAKSAAPLSADEVAVYRAVLHQWNSDGRTSLNVSDRTFPLDVASPANDISNCECLKGMELESLVRASHSFHPLTRDVFPETDIRLVNPSKQFTAIQNNDPQIGIGRGKSVETAVDDAFARGLFSMSEIAFDRDRHRALVRYSFACGSLCGNGGTWVLEKVDGAWRRTGRVCAGWIS